MADRIILHSDLNCFYASVEVNENPKLRDQAIAVCGSTEERHGIVLTASYPAKRRGVKTGMANWQAVRACPGLICVPPHYDLYVKYSRLVRNIYLRYTDKMEPYTRRQCLCGQTAWRPCLESPRRKRRSVSRKRLEPGSGNTRQWRCTDTAFAAGLQYSVGVRPSRRSERADRGIAFARRASSSLPVPSPLPFASPARGFRWFAYILVSASAPIAPRFPAWDFVGAYQK